MKRKVIPFVHPRRSREELREQVCVWLARLDAGASNEEMEQLESWLAEDPRRLRMLLSMAAMWDRSLLLSELADIFPLRGKEAPLGAPRRRALLTAAALGAVAVLGGGYLGLRSLEMQEPAGFREVYETVVGARDQIDLPDGSEIILNTDTRIQVSFSREERGLILERGEAYFNVAQDKAKPFRVYVGSRVVEAVGTAFSVQQTAQKELEIIVTEGKVNFFEMAAANASGSPEKSEEKSEADPRRVLEGMPLAAGERATIEDDGRRIERTRLPAEEIELRLAWRVGMLVFQGDTLETVLKEVSRYSAVKLEAEESIRDIPVDGFFRAGDIDGLLMSMRRHFKIDHQRIDDDQILLTAGKRED